MTSDPARSAALVWLADTLRDKIWVTFRADDGYLSTTTATAEDLAEAILSAPGVVVEWRKLRLGSGLYDPDRAQPVIRVPGAWPKPQEDLAP